MFGLIPRWRWPRVDAAHKDAIRRELGNVLIRGGRPEPRTAGLVAVLSALDSAHKVLDLVGVSAQDVRELADGDCAAKTIRDAIVATQAAMSAELVASTTASATSSC